MFLNGKSSIRSISYCITTGSPIKALMKKMTKAKSGGVLIGVGMLLQLLGRGISTFAATRTDLALAGLTALLMFASVVVILFGLFRLVTGLISKA